MSKCGLCGEDFGSKSHMVIECRATISDELDTRIKEWLEKENDLNEASSILAEITRRYNNTENGGTK